MTEDDATTLTGLIYDAAFDEAGWVPVMNRLADAVGGGATAFIRKHLGTGQGRGLFSRITAAQFTAFFARFARANPLAEAIAPLPAGAFLIDWQVMEKRRLMRSEYYNEFLLRREIHGVLGLMVWRQGPDAAIINLTRPPGSGEFQPRHAAILGPFMPHLRRAVAIAERLPPWLPGARSAEPALDLWQMPTLLLAADLRLLYANPAAERILAAQDGIGLRQGMLVASDPGANRGLAALILRAAVTEPPAGGTLAVPRRSGRRPYLVQVMPRRREHVGLFPAPARVLVSLTDLDAARGPAPAAVRAAFTLTPAQAEIAAAFARGRSLRGIAGELGISLFTVRRHLADVMARTETHSQTELVQLLLRLPAADPGPAGPPSRH